MSLLRAFSGNEVRALAHGGVSLRPPEADDYEEWAALRAASREFLKPWEPTWPADDLSRPAFRRRLRRYADERRADHAFSFFVVSAESGTMLGGVTLSNIRRGVAQTATLGYWMGKPHAGKGHMTAAVRALIPFAFGELRIRRVEAACLPGNAASVSLLEKVGFRQEGYAREYLCIDGAWQDHLLFALVRGEGWSER